MKFLQEQENRKHYKAGKSNSHMARQNKKEMKEECCKGKHWHHGHGCGGAIYGLGFLGALVYYISQATTFGMGMIGFLKALVWPAFLVHALMKFLGL